MVVGAVGTPMGALVYNDGLMARSDDYIFIFIYEDLVLVFERTF